MKHQGLFYQLQEFWTISRGGLSDVELIPTKIKT